MAANVGDSMGGRFKAKVTRALRAGLPSKGAAPKVAAPRRAPLAETPDTTLPAPAPSISRGPMMKKVQKSRTFRFLGSMRYGGPVHKTGLYLLHATERVHSPFKRKK